MQHQAGVAWNIIFFLTVLVCKNKCKAQIRVWLHKGHSISCFSVITIVSNLIKIDCVYYRTAQYIKFDRYHAVPIEAQVGHVARASAAKILILLDTQYMLSLHAKCNHCHCQEFLGKAPDNLIANRGLYGTL